jgi:hypothetical protein
MSKSPDESGYHMKYDLTKIDAARSLSKRLGESAAETEQARQVLPAIRDQLIAVGLTRLLQPAEYSGGEATIRCFIEACAAKVCVSTGWCNFIWVGTIFYWAILQSSANSVSGGKIRRLSLANNDPEKIQAASTHSYRW